MNQHKYVRIHIHDHRFVCGLSQKAFEVCVLVSKRYSGFFPLNVCVYVCLSYEHKMYGIKGHVYVKSHNNGKCMVFFRIHK